MPRDDLPDVPDPSSWTRGPTAPARRSSELARTRIGARRSTGCTTARCERPMQPSRIPIRATVLRGSSGPPAAGAGTVCPRPTSSELPRACGADDLQRAAPRLVQLLHAPAARRCRSPGEACRSGSNRAWTCGTRDRSAPSSRRRSSRWLARPARDARRALGRAHERRGDGQPDGARGRARRPPSGGSARLDASAACRATRGRARLRQRSGALLGRAGARRARVPCGRLHVVASDDRVPPAGRARRRGDRRGPGRGTHAARGQRGGRVDEHRLGRRRRGARRRRASARGCGSTSTPRTAAPRACRRATPAASRAWNAPTR